MRLPRALVAALAVVALSACSEDEPDDAAEPTTESSSPTSTAPTTPTTTSTPPSPEPSTSTPAPSPPASENAFSGACGAISPEQMSDVLAGSVVREASDDGCTYRDPADPTAPTVGLAQSPALAPAQLDTLRALFAKEAGAAVQELEDVGDVAFFAVGPSQERSSTGLGAVQAKGQAVVVKITQDQDLIDPEVGQYTIDVLTVVADALTG